MVNEKPINFRFNTFNKFVENFADVNHQMLFIGVCVCVHVCVGEVN